MAWLVGIGAAVLVLALLVVVAVFGLFGLLAWTDQPPRD